MSTRLFSRHLPPAPSEPVSPLGWLVLACFVVWLVAVISAHPLPGLGGLLALMAFLRWSSRSFGRRALQLAASRPGDPLCAFARSMNLRCVDPWVVRATFEELQPYCPKLERPFPILPGDRLDEDMEIDPEDVDDIVRGIAARAGYSLEQTAQNPLYDRVETVGDLVQFIMHQPRTRPA